MLAMVPLRKQISLVPESDLVKAGSVSIKLINANVWLIPIDSAWCHHPKEDYLHRPQRDFCLSLRRSSLLRPREAISVWDVLITAHYIILGVRMSGSVPNVHSLWAWYRTASTIGQKYKDPNPQKSNTDTLGEGFRLTSLSRSLVLFTGFGCPR